MVEQLINSLINYMDGDTDRPSAEPLRYLELGVDNGNTWVEIPTKTSSGREIIKVGVDPYGKYTENITRMTSQMFFAINEGFWKQEFDIIYIDALHYSYIVDQEIRESLKILRKNGVILMDDTIPLKEASGTVYAEDMVSYCEKVSYPMALNHSEADLHFSGYPHVQGDVWRSLAKIRMRNPELSIRSVEPLCTSLLMKGKQTLMDNVPDDQLNWDFFVKHNEEILQKISTWEDLDHYLNANRQP